MIVWNLRHCLGIEKGETRLTVCFLFPRVVMETQLCSVLSDRARVTVHEWSSDICQRFCFLVLPFPLVECQSILAGVRGCVESFAVESASQAAKGSSCFSCRLNAASFEPRSDVFAGQGKVELNVRNIWGNHTAVQLRLDT